MGVGIKILVGDIIRSKRTKEKKNGKTRKKRRTKYRRRTKKKGKTKKWKKSLKESDPMVVRPEVTKPRFKRPKKVAPIVKKLGE